MRATCRGIDPVQPAFLPANYETAEHGMLVRLDPLGDLDAKTRRTKEALTQARRAEPRGTPVAG
jgi:hypothetical protein